MTNLYDALRAELTGHIDTLNVPAGAQANVVVEAPRDATKGDLASNAGLILAKPLGCSPMQVAEGIKTHYAQAVDLEKVDVVAPGFVNFTFTNAALYRQVQRVQQDITGFGRRSVYADRKPMVEYVSINPTGPIHVGHGRNAVFGDSLANLLDKTGNKVWREYLMNDAGGQIRVLVRSLHARYLQQLGEDVAVPEDGYPGEYLIDIAARLVSRDGTRWRDVSDEDVLLKELRAFAVEACMDLIRKDIDTLGIQFDRYFSEYAMHQTDTMRAAVSQLEAGGYVHKGTLPPPKGKEIKDYQPVELTLFKATEFGFAEDQAVYKRNGEPTYFGQDIAYHYDKLQRGYDLLVTVLGVDQVGSFRPLAKVIELLSGRDDAYHPVAYEMVKVVRNGQPVKLSKRSGNIVLLSDVLDEVGKDAFRFMMLSVKPTTPLVFDLAKAVEKNMENPVFYVQYAHARLASVFRQEGVDKLPQDVPLQDDLISAEARAVMVTLMRYPLMLDQAARALEPHRLTTYAQELAAAVHKWYAGERWFDAEQPAASKLRMDIAQAAKLVLADVLAVCGVSAPESM